MSNIVEAAHLSPPMKRSDAYTLIEKLFKESGKREVYVVDVSKALNISRNSAWNFLVTGEKEGKFKSRVVYPPLRIRAYSPVKPPSEMSTRQRKQHAGRGAVKNG